MSCCLCGCAFFFTLAVNDQVNSLHKGNAFLSCGISHSNYINCFCHCTFLNSAMSVSCLFKSIWKEDHHFMMLMSPCFFTDELIPVFLPLCCADWSKRALHGIWFSWHPTDSYRADDHLSVYLLTLQWGNASYFFSLHLPFSEKYMRAHLLTCVRTFLIRNYDH